MGHSLFSGFDLQYLQNFKKILSCYEFNIFYFQGFVSTIAQSITRWHRSGNNSYSRSSITRSSPDLTKVSDASYTDKPVQLTPVILGKRKAPKEMATSGLSASKRYEYPVSNP